MKLIVSLVLSFLVIFYAGSCVKCEEKDEFETGLIVKREVGIVAAQTSVEIISVMLNVAQMMVQKKFLVAISSALGPISSVIGIVGSIIGLFEKEPDIENLFAEQKAFNKKHFEALGDQVQF